MAEAPHLTVKLAASSEEFTTAMRRAMSTGLSVNVGRRFGKTAMSKALMETFVKRDVLDSFRRGAWR